MGPRVVCLLLLYAGCVREFVEGIVPTKKHFCRTHAEPFLRNPAPRAGSRPGAGKMWRRSSPECRA